MLWLLAIHMKPFERSTAFKGESPGEACRLPVALLWLTGIHCSTVSPQPASQEIQLRSICNKQLEREVKECGCGHVVLLCNPVLHVARMVAHLRSQQT